MQKTGASYTAFYQVPLRIAALSRYRIQFYLLKTALALYLNYKGLKQKTSEIQQIRYRGAMKQ